MTPKRIESPANPLVKTLRRLARKREPSFLIEGSKLVSCALAEGLDLETVVVSDGFFEKRREWRELDRPLVVVDDALFASVSTVDSPEGILAVATRPRAKAPETRGIVAVAAGVQDPGNLGALARVAEASGSRALVVLKGSADPFSPKAVRGSAGSVLRLPVHEADGLDALEGFRRIALSTVGGVDYRQMSYDPPAAIVLGSEGGGLAPEVETACEARVSIPMRGGVESLNVATAAAIVLFEALRPG